MWGNNVRGEGHVKTRETFYTDNAYDDPMETAMLNTCG